MANEEQLARLRVSIAENNRCAAWNQWRIVDNYQTTIDLSLVDLSGVDLSGTNFNKANLSRSALSEANLYRANLCRANLRGADLSGTTLRKADLRGATLIYTNLSEASLSGADLSEAVCERTIFADVYLRECLGLETVRHRGPSTIGVDTLYRSQGHIPDEFLRGCGLSEEWIGYVHALTGAIRYYSAFISYNHEDEAFATRLYNDLQANNVRCWKYTEDMRAGDKILQRVDEAIRLHDKLVIVFSEHAIESDWVAGEVEAALRREEREQRQVLFPVTIDDAFRKVSLGWAARIRRERHILDFTQWQQQQSYQPMFERFLRDLKQTTSGS